MKNKPAFPGPVKGPSVELGLTKREFFAAMAMQGFVSAGQLDDPDILATVSVLLADKLIKALEDSDEKRKVSVLE